MWMQIGRDPKEVRVKCLPCKARHVGACLCSQFSVVMFLQMSRGVAFVSSASTFRIIEIFSPRTLSTKLRFTLGLLLFWVSSGFLWSRRDESHSDRGRTKGRSGQMEEVLSETHADSIYWGPGLLWVIVEVP